MYTTREVLAAVRARNGIPSNYALARFLDVPEKTVQRWHTGRNLPDDATAARLAELGGLDAGAVVASIHAERALDPAARSLWQGIAERLHRAGLAVAAAILAALFTGGPDARAYASTRASASLLDVRPAVDGSIHWRALRRLRSLVVRLLTPSFSRFAAAA